MNQKHIINMLAVAIQADVPIYIVGPPGAGKTANTVAVAAALDAHLEVNILSQKEPTDIAGMPVLIEDELRYAPPAWARRAHAAASAGRLAIIFNDEFTWAPPAVQAAALRVVHERWCGELHFHPNVRMVMAANSPEQGGGYDLTAPMANRMAHFDWAVDTLAWCDGMTAGWPVPDVPWLPKGWESSVGVTSAVLATYLRKQPHRLMSFPENASEQGRAWPSPRTWSLGARLMAATEAGGLGEDDRLMALSGCVGHGQAVEFLAWLRDLDLPDPEEQLAQPDKFKLPARGDQQAALLAAIAACVIRDPSGDRFAAGWRCCARAAKQGGADVAGPAARALSELMIKRKDLVPPYKDVETFAPLLQRAGLWGKVS